MRARERASERAKERKRCCVALGRLPHRRRQEARSLARSPARPLHCLKLRARSIVAAEATVATAAAVVVAAAEAATYLALEEAANDGEASVRGLSRWLRRTNGATATAAAGIHGRPAAADAAPTDTLTHGPTYCGTGRALPMQR